MSNLKPKTFAVYWADTKQLLTKEERRAVLQVAILEALSPDEVLLRDPDNGKLIVVRNTDGVKGLFCSLCRSNLSHERYGRSCPEFATCVYKDKHLAKKEEQN
jgi:hypothetical protein